ncbi:MAG: DNA primase [Candidatus Cloacimonetes bacterium]|nr:DNA primase [Candidatus Cloacimonadota bacterium]
MLDQRIIDQIIEGNDIVSVVEQYLPLKRTGTNYKACCPFHDEKTPSFIVSDKKQIFKCFGCGKGGNVIHFVKEIENISFFEALQKLAIKAGIKLQKQDKVETKKQTRQDLLLKVYELAKDHYEDNLHRFGDVVLTNLEERGISKSTINKFEIGYALNSTSGLYNHLVKSNINKQILENSGLFVKTQRGMVDLFRERIIFPIHSANGSVVAFGARVVHADQQGGKYINSPTTELYTKGKELYGFYLTKNEIRKLNYALVTEGYTDFLRLYENGFINSVATLGTAFTEEQVKSLIRYSKNIYLLYDGDLAGKKAALKAAESIILTGAFPKIVTLPDGEDADSFLKKHSREDLKVLIDNADPMIEYLHKNTDLGLEIKEKLETLLEIANQFSDLLNRELFVKEIARVFNLSLPSLTQRIRKSRRSNKKVQSTNLTRTANFKFMEEKNFLILLINGMIEDIEELSEIDSGYFFNDDYKKVFETLQSFDYIIDNDKVASILVNFEEKDAMLVKIISELSLVDIPPVPYKEVINDLKIRKYQNELREIDNTIVSGHDSFSAMTRKKELLEKIRNTSRKVVHKNRM